MFEKGMVLVYLSLSIRISSYLKGFSEIRCDIPRTCERISNGCSQGCGLRFVTRSWIRALSFQGDENGSLCPS